MYYSHCQKCSCNPQVSNYEEHNLDSSCPHPYQMGLSMDETDELVIGNLPRKLLGSHFHVQWHNEWIPSVVYYSTTQLLMWLVDAWWSACYCDWWGACGQPASAIGGGLVLSLLLWFAGAWCSACFSVAQHPFYLTLIMTVEMVSQQGMSLSMCVSAHAHEHPPRPASPSVTLRPQSTVTAREWVHYTSAPLLAPGCPLIPHKPPIQTKQIRLDYTGFIPACIILPSLTDKSQVKRNLTEREREIGVCYIS